MSPNAPTSRGGLGAMFDAGAEKLGEVGLLVILALVKGWNTYQDRRSTKRGGRRASDRDDAAVLRSIKRLEEIGVELTKGLAQLTARVKSLERKVDKADE